MVDIFRPPYFQPSSVNGVPLAGAKLYFYQAGTTTDITVYQDSGLVTPHAQPVVADASGIFAAIYTTESVYKIVLKTSADVTVKTYDNVNSFGSALESFTVTSTDAGASAAPVITLYRNSASPAASDIIGKILFDGEDSAGNTQEYASVEAVITDPTSTSEDAALDFYAPIAGSRTRYLALGRNAAGTATANAVGLPLGQLSFPATQNASSDANTLDDYEEGSWTPTITFVTPGDLSVTYATQVGRYEKIGRLVIARFSIVTSAFTHTTASGDLAIQTLPFLSGNVSGLTRAGSLIWSGITKAGYTNISPQVAAATANIGLEASGSGVAQSSVTVGDMPTGGAVRLHGTITYEV